MTAPDMSPDTHPRRPDPKDRAETVRYIGRMASELKGLAASAELDFVAYLLSMVEEDLRRGS
ncbi:MAG: hypothetical protein J0I45_15590 [Bosea sp.]|nr:hypothetical protein [Bosea sp. (in: a-proteobacteria)]